MKSCTKCGRPEKPLRRGLCKACYASASNRIGWETILVPAQPARDHINRLRASGMSLRQIHERSGVPRTTLHRLFHGRRGNPPPPVIWESTAERLLAIAPVQVTWRNAPNNQLVDATGTRRRLQTLVAAGWPRAQLGRRIGWQPSNMPDLFRRERVTAATARKVAALFDELQLTPGPSTRARNEGKRNRWPLPLDWDEDSIDDPAASTKRSEPVRAPFVERFAEARELESHPEKIAARMGISVESLWRQAYRHGLGEELAS